MSEELDIEDLDAEELDIMERIDNGRHEPAGVPRCPVSKCKKCGGALYEHYFGEGYCSRECLSTSIDHEDRQTGETVADRLCDPTDPTGERIIAKTRGEIDAMLEAVEIDVRLPRIIYLRRRGMSERKVDETCGYTENTCRRVLKKCPRRLLQRCGLRR